MTSDHSANLETARRFHDAIEAGDIQTVIDSCTEDALFWRNYDRAYTSPVDISQALKWLPVTFRNFRYGDRRTVLGVDGSVFQQHALYGTTASGREIDVPIMVQIHFRDGLISAIDEYTDSAQMQVVIEELTPILRARA